MLHPARANPRTSSKANSQGASMNLLISVFYDWSRVVAGYFTWAGPLAVRIVVGIRRLSACRARFHAHRNASHGARRRSDRCVDAPGDILLVMLGRCQCPLWVEAV